MHEFELMMRTLGWIAAAVIGLVWLLHAGWVWATRARRLPLLRAPRVLQGVRALQMLALVAAVWALLLQLHVLQRGAMFMSDAMRLGLTALVLGWLLFGLAVLAWPPLPHSRRRVLAGAASTAVLVLLAWPSWQAWRSVHADPPEAAVRLSLPFDGEWVATGAGASAITNHHHRIASQRHAIDFARRCDDGRLFRGDGSALEHACAFGADVLAPADGEVVLVVDGVPDSGVREPLAGNHVVIRIADGVHVALAHLQQHSVQVAVGDRVRRGDLLGRAGNSGNSDFAHLHIHVQDGVEYDLRTSVSTPVRFTDLERRRALWWRAMDDAVLIGGDQVRPRATGGSRR